MFFVCKPWQWAFELGHRVKNLCISSQVIKFNTLVAKLIMGWLCAVLLLAYWLKILKRTLQMWLRYVEVLFWSFSAFKKGGGSDKKWLRLRSSTDLQQDDVAPGTPYKCKDVFSLTKFTFWRQWNGCKLWKMWGRMTEKSPELWAWEHFCFVVLTSEFLLWKIRTFS